MRTVLSIAALSYVLGSIPFGYLLVRFFRGEDVRKSGSGNVGATNVARKSPVLGVLTLLLDAGKGGAAVLGSSLLAQRLTGKVNSQELALAGLFAIVGHIFSVWLKFRGGKGVATGFGCFLWIAPQATLVAAIVFLLVVLISRYVSLGSIVAAAVLPGLVWRIYRGTFCSSALVMTALASLLIIAKHHENIRRLLAGTENRFGAKRA
jgi:acyl phosphate:glycerol-3-phosphate acyltransferase